MDDRTVIVRRSSDHMTVTTWGTRIGRWSSGHPQASVRRPGGDRAVYIWPAEQKFWTVAHGLPCSDQQAAGRRLTDEWIFVTSADHPAKFNCELKWLGHCRMSKGWALQECLFGRRQPDFCRIWCKTRRAAIRRSIFLYWDVGLNHIVIMFICRKTLQGRVPGRNNLSWEMPALECQCKSSL